MSRIDDGRLPDVIREVAAPLASALGAELLEVAAVKGGKGRRLVRLVVSSELPDDDLTTEPDPGLDVETIAALSRGVGDAVDDLDTGAYTLEVTSPGADRPMTTARDFARAVGRDVRLVKGGSDEPGEITGTITAAWSDGLTIEVAGEEIEVPLDVVDHGKVVLPW